MLVEIPQALELPARCGSVTCTFTPGTPVLVEIPQALEVTTCGCYFTVVFGPEFSLFSEIFDASDISGSDGIRNILVCRVLEYEMKDVGGRIHILHESTLLISIYLESLGLHVRSAFIVCFKINGVIPWTSVLVSIL